MATNFIQARSLKYLNKDFQGIKRDLIKFSQAHHSGVFQDFNEASPGMAILELCAYVGDILSFYQDMQFEEIKHESARQIDNVVAIAKQFGYRPSGKRAARGIQTFFIEVPAVVKNSAVVPDDKYTPILRKGAKVQGPNGVIFETLDDIHFTASSPTFGTDAVRMITGSKFDDHTGLATHFAIRKDVPIIAGETKTAVFTINDFQQFKTIELPEGDVIEVLSVEDSDNEEWTEVEYLAQEMVFDSATNSADDRDTVPFIMKMRTVPRRFITDRNPITNKTSLIFGSGKGMSFDDELIPNLADLSLPLPGRKTFTSFTIDPQNFLKTMSLGLSPFNTTLTVKYRVGGGEQTNVPPASIKTVSDATLDFSSTEINNGIKSLVIGSLETFNKKRTDGGGSSESIAEIKANSAAYFAAQNRTVTKEDYIARIMSLPSKFGKPDKVYVKRTNTLLNSLSLDIHILSRDPYGNLVKATSTLADNIKTYLSSLRMLTDGVNILGSDIINLRVEFGIVVSPKMNRSEVLAKCLDVVRDFVDIDKMQIGQPLIVSELMSELQQVLGVISVYKLEFKNMFGMNDDLSYSETRYNVRANTANNILYCPQNAIFEVKFPTKDIIGESK